VRSDYQFRIVNSVWDQRPIRAHARQVAHEQIYAHTEAALIAVDHQSVSMSHSTAQIWIAGFGCLVLIAACRTSGGGAASSGSGAAGAGTSGTGTTGTAASTGASGSVTGGAGFADAGPGGTSGASGVSPTDDGETCGITTDKIRITEIDVGAAVVNNELDSNPPQPGLMPIAISPIPSGGSRVAWMGTDSMVHITQLDANDQVVAGSTFGLPAVDLQDIYADDNGGVLLLSRNAMGGGNLNCGNINNLCGASASYPTTDPCYDLYMVRFDGTTETWATELTDSTTALPPYDTSATSSSIVYFVWWYAHNGRIAFDGSHYAGYFGTAISVSQACTDATSTLTTGINIHQGDRMKIVNAAGVIQTGGFDLGCSHSGYERVIWDPTATKFIPVCQTDNNNRIAIAPNYATVYPVDLSYSSLGNVVVASGGGYWATVSNIRPGQPAGMYGLADVHLLHFSTGTADQDITLASDPGLNDRAPHLASYGTGRLLAAWETSTAIGVLAANDKNRKLYIQALDSATGAAEGPPVNVAAITGNRYQDFRTFPDGSVAYPAPGSTSTKLKIVRVLPCSP
jgi:hypothetical protein